MSWSIGFDSIWNRDVGYGVPAVCDHPKCNAEIDRVLGYVCGGEPFGGEKGCGLYFCGAHLIGQLCPKCARYDKNPYKPKPDTAEWMRWKLEHESWAVWRKENPKEVAKIRGALAPEKGTEP